MIISRLQSSTVGGWARLSAEVVHENAAVPLASLYIEVPEQYASWLHEVYDPFAIACFAPATAHRESRLLIEGDLCPRVVDGLRVAMTWYRHWYGKQWTPLAIESGRRPYSLRSTVRAGAVFLSCGVDSLYSLREIGNLMPATHPAAPQVALFAIGYDLRIPAATARALANAQAASEALGLTLVPIRSNIPTLDDDYKLWKFQFGGPAFAALPHALGRGIERAWLGADVDIATLEPWCNHPATAPEFSSHDVEIRQDGIEATRGQKVGAIASWDIARRFLRVCTRNPVSSLNCGSCEKCVRTRLEMLAFGNADALPAFGGVPLAASNVLGMSIRMDLSYYEETIEPLRALGRLDLIAAIRDRQHEWARHKRWHAGGGLRGRIRRVLASG